MKPVTDLAAERARRRPEPGLDLDEQLALAGEVLRGIKAEADTVLFLESTATIRKLGQVYATLTRVVADRAHHDERTSR